jgi:hypothetical protein
MRVEDDSAHVVMQRYRLRRNEKGTDDDFDEYLSDRSRFFEMFRRFMHEYDRLDRLFGGSLVLAHNTFVHYVSQDAWAAHLERIGAVAVSSERHAVAELRPILFDRNRPRTLENSHGSLPEEKRWAEGNRSAGRARFERAQRARHPRGKAERGV